MPIVYAVAVPHPPLILPQVGRGEERGIQRTADAFRAAMEAMAAARPQAVVVASPHTVMYADYNHISPGAGAGGDFAQYRAPDTRLQAAYHQPLARRIAQLALEQGLAAGMEGERDAALDHGTMIPLLFLQQALAAVGGAAPQGDALPPIVRVGLSGLPLADHYRLGQCIAAAAGELRVGFIASGDLSHKLLQDGPYGYAPEGPRLDAAITAALEAGDFAALLAIPPALADKGAECGLRSFVMMAGALDALAVKPRLLSYEGPFGVGYAVAAFAPGAPDASRRFLQQDEDRRARQAAERRQAEDPWVQLARAQIESVVSTGKELPLPAGLPPQLAEKRAGVFVSLHLAGELRGCIGTVAPTTGSVALEILQNAVSAAQQDPRFPPVRSEEVPLLEINVDVLEAPEPIETEAQLDPARYGVIVTSGARRGLLLPDLDGVDTPAQQVEIARRKAGIPAGAPVKLERFRVIRHT